MTDTQITVGIDIDGPLYELVPVLRNRIHRTTGRPLDTLPEPTMYDLARAWDLPGQHTIRDLLVEGVKDGDVFWQGDAHEPGLKGLRALKEHDYRVVLISARDLPGVEDLCREATLHWLDSVGAVFDELILTSDKNRIHFDFLYDDYEVNVRAAHSIGRDAILQNRSWNRDVDLPQAHWDEVPDLVAQAVRQVRAA